MKIVKGLLMLVFVCFVCSGAVAEGQRSEVEGQKAEVKEIAEPVDQEEEGKDQGSEVGGQKSEVKEKEVKEEEPIGLKSGTVIPQGILKRITQHLKDLNYSNLQQIAIKLAIEKYQALWTKEFDVWLASEKVPLPELSLWTISGNKAVLKK